MGFLTDDQLHTTDDYLMALCLHECNICGCNYVHNEKCSRPFYCGYCEICSKVTGLLSSNWNKIFVAVPKIQYFPILLWIFCLGGILIIIRYSVGLLSNGIGNVNDGCKCNPQYVTSNRLHISYEIYQATRGKIIISDQGEVEETAVWTFSINQTSTVVFFNF